jgi:probable non-F420 flavinoid oxidoreductase
MTQIGYQASHEQFSPAELLRIVQRADEAGFQVSLSSDHIHPWSKDQGHSGFALVWLGAALQATRLTFGMVTVPGYRYHPAVLAQAVATLVQMFPGRFFLTMGSGEALNEHITGQPWPVKAVRNEILKESAMVRRRLWQGEEVTHAGRITVEQARVYIDLPEPPEIIGAALSEPTARWLGSWADGMITTARPLPELRAMVEAFQAGGGQGRRLVLKADISYDPDPREALRGAREQWRYSTLPAAVLAELKTVAMFDALSERVTEEEVAAKVKVTDSAAELVDWIGSLATLGFEKIVLHNVNRKQDQAIDFLGEHVLPQIPQPDRPTSAPAALSAEHEKERQ